MSAAGKTESRDREATDTPAAIGPRTRRRIATHVVPPPARVAVAEPTEQDREGEGKMVVFGRFVEATRGMILRDGVGPAHRAPASASAVAVAEAKRPERDCLQACRECQAACLEMVGYSVRMQGYYSELGHVRLLEDCARLCELAVDFVLRGSELRGALLALCAETCQRCARDCARFDYDQRLLACAGACERCAEACAGVAA